MAAQTVAIAEAAARETAYLAAMKSWAGKAEKGCSTATGAAVVADVVAEVAEDERRGLGDPKQMS